MKEKKVKKEFRCGVVSIVGRPNVGKSTLINKLIGEKIAIVTPVPQTTRNQIRGIYHDERGQIIFIDTPGIHLGRDRLDKFMNQSSTSTIADVDCLIYLTDTSRRIGQEENYIAQEVAKAKCPVILGLNKVDLRDGIIDEYISFWEKIKGEPVTEMKKFSMIALSSEKEINIEQLIDIIFSYLPKGPALYPTDIISDIPQKIMISDIIREKLFLLMKEEVPHSIGVSIIHIQPKKKKTIHIKADIFVERESQKEIVIGKHGGILKEAGTKAREELERLLESKVFLELYVKCEKSWRNDAQLLQDLGYQS